MTEKSKRPIDRLRDGAVSMKIGEPGARIAEMLVLDSRLHIVTADAVHLVQLADETDPDRTNASIPNSHQRALDAGAENPIVGKLLLTADALFKRECLGNDFDQERALSLAWSLTKHVCAMDKLRLDLEAAEQHAVDEFSEPDRKRGQLTLPTVGGPDQRFHSFAQKLGHALDTFRDIAGLFYSELPRKWIDQLAETSASRYGSDHPFAKYMSDVQPALLFMRELRNVIEHPKPQRCARILDFRLTPGGEIERPSIELIWPGHEGTSSLAALMSTLTENLSTIAEVLMAHFCNVNVRNQGSLEIFVTELPEEQRRHRTVRLGYACYLGRQLVRFG